MKMIFHFLIFLLIGNGCRDIKIKESFPIARNTEINLHKDISYDSYLPLIRSFAAEIEKSHNGLYGYLDNSYLKLFQHSEDYKGPLKTGFDVKGIKGGLDEDNWKKAIEGLNGFIKALKEKANMEILELFEKECPSMTALSKNHFYDNLITPILKESTYFNSTNPVFKHLSEISQSTQDREHFLAGIFKKEKILYFHLSGFHQGMFTNETTQYFIEKAISGELKKIILDLRANFGDYAYDGSIFLSIFFDKDKEIPYRKREIKRPYNIDPSSWSSTTISFKPHCFDEDIFEDNIFFIDPSTPIVILVDGHSAGMAERAVMILRERENTTVIGSPTAGCWVDILAQADKEDGIMIGKNQIFELINPHNQKRLLKWTIGDQINRSLRENESKNLLVDIEVNFKGGIKDPHNHLLIDRAEKDIQLQVAIDYLKKKSINKNRIN